MREISHVTFDSMCLLGLYSLEIFLKYIDNYFFINPFSQNFLRYYVCQVVAPLTEYKMMNDE